VENNILLINDMPGYGKVALSAMIPILSNMGCSVYNLPTALVSNTLDYGKFEILDTTNYMKNTIKVWEQLNFKFDCISTGFIVSEEQVKIISDYICKKKNDKTLVVVDPIMGDDGKLYNGITNSVVENMRKLCSIADVIIPNYTEAAFITGMFKEKASINNDEIKLLIDKLRENGAKSVVITSIKNSTNNSFCVCGYSNKSSEYFMLPYEYIPVRFPGTGDIFSSIMIGKLLRGSSLKESVCEAMNCVAKLMILNKDNVDKYKGILIEQFIEEIREDIER